MYLHNYSMSVPQLISQINRPAEKALYIESLATYSTTNQGSEENYIDYLKFGAAPSPCLSRCGLTIRTPLWMLLT